jgi:hypothetical protein
MDYVDAVGGFKTRRPLPLACASAADGGEGGACVTVDDEDVEEDVLKLRPPSN